MTLSALKGVHESRPFRPFTMHLASGRSLRVENPGMFAFLGNGRTVFVAHSKSDKFELIDLLMITSVDVGSTKGGSGSGRKRAA